MPNENKEPTPPPTMEDRVTAVELRSAVSELGLEIPAEATGATLLRLLTDKIRALQPIAKIGVELRARLVEDTIKEGIRAMGDKFDAEKQRALLNSLDVANVDAMREAWAGIAAVLFQPGRETIDERQANGEMVGSPATDFLSDAAFGG